MNPATTTTTLIHACRAAASSQSRVLALRIRPRPKYTSIFSASSTARTLQTSSSSTTGEASQPSFTTTTTESTASEVADAGADAVTRSLPSLQAIRAGHARNLTPAQTRAADALFLASTPLLTGTVTRISTRKTVRVSTTKQVFNTKLQKHFSRPRHFLVHDAAETLNEGDVVRFSLFAPSVRAARQQAHKGDTVRHEVREVVSPFGAAVEGREGRAGMFVAEEKRAADLGAEAARRREKAERRAREAKARGKGKGRRG